MDFAQSAAARPGAYKEIYFCLSTQAVTGGKTRGGYDKAHRHASKAISLKAIWLDIDCGPAKDYPDQGAAVVAVSQFCKDADLPPPTALVFSGGGVHVYWISDKPLEPAVWRQYAEGLKSEALRLSLCKDTGIIADAARILRVPGTFNNKITGMPRAVTLKHLADTDYDFATQPQLQRLTTLAPKQAAAATAAVTTQQAPSLVLPPAFATGMAKAFAAFDPADSLAKGIGQRDLSLPLKIEEVVKGCRHFQDCAVTHGANQSQGLWSLTLLACSFFEDGERWAHYFSKGYPTYDHGETQTKYEEKLKYKAENNLGWPGCSAFEGEGAKCKTCPFYQKVRSPLNLAERIETPRAPVATFMQTALVEELSLPDGFSVDERGCICEQVEKQVGDTTETTYVPLFLSRLRNFRAQGGHRMLLFETSLDKGKWGNAQIVEAVDLINETSIIKALRTWGVKPNTNYTNHPRRIINFMTSFMEKLDAEKERQKSIPFGWLREEENTKTPVGFAYGGRVAMSDGSERSAGYADQKLEAFYKPKGDPQPWWELHDVITGEGHIALEVVAATGFAAPLMTGTGLYNGVVCGWSSGSGARKSTSVALGAAVWGNPKLTKEHPGTSNKGMLKKLGTVKSLPVYWDEVNRPEKMDKVVDILGDITEGSAGSKLTSGRDFAEYDEWQTMMIVTANQSITAAILREVRDTDAQLQRTFEFEIEKRAGHARGANIDTLVNSLDYNYGHVGLAYSKLLGNNAEAVLKLTKDTRIKFEDELALLNADGKVRDEERFRVSLAAAIHAGATLANQVGCKFHLDGIWEFLKAEFLKQKEMINYAQNVAGTADNTVTLFTEFLKHTVDRTLWVGNLPKNTAGRPEPITWIGGVNRTNHKDSVDVRFAVYDRFVDVSKPALLDYFKMRKIVGANIVTGLRSHYGATEVPRVNLALGAGVAGGREKVVRIPIPEGSPWEDDLFAHTAPDQRVAAAVTTGVVAGLAAATQQAAADLARVSGAVPGP